MSWPMRLSGDAEVDRGPLHRRVLAQAGLSGARSQGEQADASLAVRLRIIPLRCAIDPLKLAMLRTGAPVRR